VDSFNVTSDDNPHSAPRGLHAGYEHDPALEYQGALSGGGANIYTIESYAHVRHRVYSTELGRWTRRDPLGYITDASLYLYCRSQAVISTDILGLAPTSLQRPDAIIALCEMSGEALGLKITALILGGMAIEEVAKQLGISVEAVRMWYLRNKGIVESVIDAGEIAITNALALIKNCKDAGSLYFIFCKRTKGQPVKVGENCDKMKADGTNCGWFAMQIERHAMCAAIRQFMELNCPGTHRMRSGEWEAFSKCVARYSECLENEQKLKDRDPGNAKPANNLGTWTVQ
jgi:RHS repeat-associated protein